MSSAHLLPKVPASCRRPDEHPPLEGPASATTARLRRVQSETCLVYVADDPCSVNVQRLPAATHALRTPQNASATAPFSDLEKSQGRAFFSAPCSSLDATRWRTQALQVLTAASYNWATKIKTAVCHNDALPWVMALDDTLAKIADSTSFEPDIVLAQAVADATLALLPIICFRDRLFALDVERLLRLLQARAMPPSRRCVRQKLHEKLILENNTNRQVFWQDVTKTLNDDKRKEPSFAQIAVFFHQLKQFALKEQTRPADVPALFEKVFDALLHKNMFYRVRFVDHEIFADTAVHGISLLSQDAPWAARLDALRTQLRPFICDGTSNLTSALATAWSGGKPISFGAATGVWSVFREMLCQDLHFQPCGQADLMTALPKLVASNAVLWLRPDKLLAWLSTWVSDFVKYDSFKPIIHLLMPLIEQIETRAFMASSQKAQMEPWAHGASGVPELWHVRLDDGTQLLKGRALKFGSFGDLSFAMDQEASLWALKTIDLPSRLLSLVNNEEASCDSVLRRPAHKWISSYSRAVSEIQALQRYGGSLMFRWLFVCDGTLTFAMRPMAGELSRLTGVNLSWLCRHSITRRAGEDVSRQLGAMHKEQTAHLDIKPDNLLLAWQGHVVLGDLGLSRPVPVTKGERFDIGTLAYRSPEQTDMEMRERLSVKSDVYSCGLTLLELLAGPIPSSRRAQTIILSPHAQELRLWTLRHQDALRAHGITQDGRIYECWMTQARRNLEIWRSPGTSFDMRPWAQSKRPFVLRDYSLVQRLLDVAHRAKQASPAIFSFVRERMLNYDWRSRADIGEVFEFFSKTCPRPLGEHAHLEKAAAYLWQSSSVQKKFDTLDQAYPSWFATSI